MLLTVALLDGEEVALMVPFPITVVGVGVEVSVVFPTIADAVELAVIFVIFPVEYVAVDVMVAEDVLLIVEVADAELILDCVALLVGIATNTYDDVDEAVDELEVVGYPPIMEGKLLLLEVEVGFPLMVVLAVDDNVG